jgi:flagellar hook-associated protein FlgK
MRVRQLRNTYDARKLVDENLEQLDSLGLSVPINGLSTELNKFFSQLPAMRRVPQEEHLEELRV